MKYIVIASLFFLPNFALSKNIVFLGDSITEGYGIDKEKSYPSLLNNELKKTHPNTKVINSSIPGSTSASAVSRLKWVLKSKPDILFLALGGNDGLRGVKLESTQANLQKAIVLAKKNNVKVVLGGVRIPTNYGQQYRTQFEKLYIDLAKINNVLFVPYILKDVAGQKKLNLPDGIHPNEKGHQVIFKNILPVIKKLL